MRSQQPLSAVRRLGVAVPRAVLALVVVALVLVSEPAVRPSAAATSASATTCGSAGIAVTAPAYDLAAIVQNNAPGTCFSLGAGTYKFSDVVPKDGMSFIGAGAGLVIVDGRGHENAFHGTADRVTIAHMTFENFDNSGGTKRQEQSPIRGTRALWASFRGTMATNWTIDSVVSRNNFASGIFLGDNFTVVNSVFSGNGTTGIAGNEIEGGLIENNLVFRNGAQQAGGALVNGGGLKVTQAGTPDKPLIVRGNEFYENVDIAVWCDISCRGFHAIDNYIHDHRSSGIVIELSSGAVIEGNRIENSSTWSDFFIDFNAGAITIAESSNSVVRNNYVSGARGGVIVRQTRRPFLPAESFLDKFQFVNYVTGDVLVEKNVFVATDMMGFTVGQTGAGIVPNPASIRFVANRYADPSSVQFHHNGVTYNHSTWLAAGYDAGAASGPLPTAGSYGPSRGTLPLATPAPRAQPPAAPAQPTTAPAGSTASETRSPNLPLRINAGGGEMTDENGVVWIEDSYFVEGSKASHAEGRDIGSTSLDALYRDERWGATGYSIPVPNGTYRVITHHGEVYEGCQKRACRVFDVSVEGAEMADDLDIFSRVGGFTAMQLERTVVVEDGVLDLSFSAVKQSAQVSGIEIIPATQPSSALGSAGGAVGSGSAKSGGAGSTAGTTSRSTGTAAKPTTYPRNGPSEGTAVSASVDQPGAETGLSTGLESESADGLGRPDAAAPERLGLEIESEVESETVADVESGGLALELPNGNPAGVAIPAQYGGDGAAALSFVAASLLATAALGAWLTIQSARQRRILNPSWLDSE